MSVCDGTKLMHTIYTTASKLAKHLRILLPAQFIRNYKHKQTPTESVCPGDLRPASVADRIYQWQARKLRQSNNPRRQTVAAGTRGRLVRVERSWPVVWQGALYVLLQELDRHSLGVPRQGSPVRSMSGHSVSASACQHRRQSQQRQQSSTAIARWIEVTLLQRQSVAVSITIPNRPRSPLTLSPESHNPQ